MRVAFVGLMVAGLGMGGCASVVRGTTEPIAFISNPPGATVAMSNGLQCPSTPCELKISRKDEFAATFTKPGY